MKFKLYTKYTNVYFKDIMINVLEIEELTDGFIGLTVGWWNKGQTGTPFPIPAESKIVVSPDQINDWREYVR